jgi:hypothetical protein
MRTDGNHHHGKSAGAAMILCGHSLFWLALVGLVGIVAVCVVFSIGYFCGADRWIDRSRK